MRLEVLTAHGGVWLDATVALTSPLESWIHPAQNHGTLVGFELDFQGVQDRDVDPLGENWSNSFHPNGSLIRALGSDQVQGRALYFESWGFAAGKDNLAVRLWRDEFRRAAFGQGGFQAYCDGVAEEAGSHSWLHPSFTRWLPYLTIHLTLAHVRHANPGLLSLKGNDPKPIEGNHF